MSVKLTMGPMSHAQSGGNDFIYRKDLYRYRPPEEEGAQEKRGAKLLIGFVKKEAANRATAAEIGLKNK